jgi:cobalt-zinc-cadmium efflux system outer membrane protein
VLKQFALCLAALIMAGCAGRMRPSDDTGSKIAQLIRESGCIKLEQIGGPLDAAGQEPDVLNLQEAIRLAVHNDPGLQAALARVRAAEADVEQSRTLPNPILSIALRYPDSGGKPIIEAGLTAELVALLQRHRRSAAAEHRLRTASAEALASALDLLLEVQQHYAALQTAEAQISVFDNRQKVLDRLIAIAEARLKAGEANRLELTTLQARRLELETERAERRAERVDERLALARLIGQPSSSAIWQVTPWQAPLSLSWTEAQLIASALEKRPEVQAGQSTLLALGDELALTKWSAWENSEVGIASERDDGWSIGPSITTPVPLFDWGRARRAKAKAEVIEARHKLTQARREAVEEVRRAYAAFQSSSAAAARAQSELIPIQMQRREQAEAAYKAGETDVTVLLLAEQDLQDSQAKLIELQGRASAGEYRLQRAVGGPISPSAIRSSGGAATRPALQQNP